MEIWIGFNEFHESLENLRVQCAEKGIDPVSVVVHLEKERPNFISVRGDKDGVPYEATFVQDMDVIK